MKFNLIFLLIILSSCTQNYSKVDSRQPFSSKGFAYIYNDEDFQNKIIKKKLDEKNLLIAHSKLRPGSLIK